MASERTKQIVNALKDEDNGSETMRVVGRGTLIMSARSVRNSRKFKDLIKKADVILKGYTPSNA